MDIILNNRNESFDADQLTINELLAVKNFTFKMLVVKVNGELVRRRDFDIAIVKDGDDVMVLHLITGG
ncbi:MAG: thiamine biosynthesis protein ThiS [Bacteroidetes bacterium HGW-Bacteroidetes-11]|jgi:thiamine biosynthesis protein ThiS|nr:MAG: thiamine biosynthesis protein ThiS [Bacteroidetes bacterium HGW-Bacteroidetes-11]